MPKWVYQRNVDEPRAAPSGERSQGLRLLTRSRENVPAANAGALGDAAPRPAERDRSAPPSAHAPAAVDSLVVREDLLPAYERLFGTGPRDPEFKEGVRSAAAGLIHADATATVLIARGHQYFADTFKELLVRSGFQPREPMVNSSSDFILGLYKKAEASVERRRVYDDASNPAEAQKVLQSILEQALAMGASDLHFHVLGDAKPARSVVKFRVHGELIPQAEMLCDPNVANSVMRAAYTGDFADKQSRSHTSFNTVEGMYATLQVPAIRNLRLRLQTVQAVHGYGVNLRVLSYDGIEQGFSSLEAMGFSAEHAKDIVESLDVEDGGLMLFVGSTGQGKTATALTAIPLASSFATRNWVTIEDPVEVIHPALFQCPVRRNTSNASDVGEHVAAMKNLLRFDPDGIFAGEIRDEITMQLAERSAMTGHVTVATLHGNDPFVAYQRLLDFGAKKVNLLDGVLQMICRQRLIKTLCDKCAVKAKDSQLPAHRLFLRELEALYKVDASQVRVRGKGCDCCFPRGHVLAGIGGRTAVAEIVRFDPTIVSELHAGSPTRARDAWRAQRVADYHEPGTLGKNIGEHALFKLLHGVIGPETYLGVAGSFTTQRPVAIKRRERVAA